MLGVGGWLKLDVIPNRRQFSLGGRDGCYAQVPATSDYSPGEEIGRRTGGTVPESRA